MKSFTCSNTIRYLTLSQVVTNLPTALLATPFPILFKIITTGMKAVRQQWSIWSVDRGDGVGAKPVCHQWSSFSYPFVYYSGNAAIPGGIAIAARDLSQRSESRRHGGRIGNNPTVLLGDKVPAEWEGGWRIQSPVERGTRVIRS